MDPQKGIRILHVIDSAGLYGAETMLLGLMDEQLSLGNHPILCSIGTFDDGRKDIELAAEQKGHYVIPARIARSFSLSGIRALLKIAREQKVDLIHSHGYKGDILLGALSKKLRKLPMVSTIHGWTGMRKLSRIYIYEWFDCLCLNGADAVITVNSAMLASSRFRWLFVKNKIQCIPNGIADFSCATTLLPVEDPIPLFCRGHFIVGALGRLSPEKGYDLLIKAFGRLHEAVSDARLVIIGEGPERETLETLVKQLGLDDHILMPGFREHARRYLPLFSCFVISSYTEGLPMSLLEAMLTEIPVVSTDVGSIAEVLEADRNGTLVEAGDIEGLFRAMLWVFNNTSLAADKAFAARATIVSKYSAKAMAKAYNKVYCGLLSPA
jgi:glycosyltransferase involved in cell wall biosynthesis